MGVRGPITANVALLLCGLASCCVVLVLVTSNRSGMQAVQPLVALAGADEPQLTATRFTVLSADDPVYRTLPAAYRPIDDELPSCRLIIPFKQLTASVQSEPFYQAGGSLPINTVLSIEYLNHPDLDDYYDALGASYRKHNLHRKAWEWAMGVRTLHEMGAIKPDAVGLSLAAGHEPVHYYLSNHIKMMYAGDMYGVGGFAADGTASKDILDHPERFAPEGVEWRKEHLKLLWQNARNLTYFKDSTLDFVVSFGSIEHFGGGTEDFQAARESITEQARILKPGGIVFMTTELSLLDHDHMLGNVWNVKQLKRAILGSAQAAGLELVQPINWGITKSSLLTPVFLGTYGDPALRCSAATPHNIVCLGNRDQDRRAGPFTCFTTISLAFRKSATAGLRSHRTLI